MQRTSSHDPLENVFRLSQRTGKLFDVLRPAGFHGEIDGRVAEVHPEIRAVVGGGDDVRAQLREHYRETMQCTRVVWKMYSQTHQAAVFDQAALDDARK